MDIAIVGAGASGTLTAIRLLERGPGSPRIALIERGDRFGPGLAYGAASPCHLLNVPASGMSAFEEAPLHFLRWLGDVSAGDFVPRVRFGAYLTALLSEAAERAPGRLLQLRADVGAGALVSGGVRLRTRDGITIQAERAVLALGNPVPSKVPGLADPLTVGEHFRNDPWAPNALAGLDPDADVLLLGTGLTAVDVLLALRARHHRGTVFALSRRGLLPRVHAAHPAIRVEPLPTGASAATLLRAFRNEVRSAEVQGGDFRSVIDAIRPELPALWGSLLVADRARLLRHARAAWDVHRHRMAPEIWEQVSSELGAGTFMVRAGRIHAADPDASGVTVRYRPRGSGRLEHRRAARVLNCTGPGRMIDHPEMLVSSLVGAGVARHDPFGMGLSTAPDGRLLDREGRPQDALWTLGPPRRGDLFESTALPEIRAQAKQLAATLLEATGR